MVVTKPRIRPPSISEGRYSSKLRVYVVLSVHVTCLSGIHSDPWFPSWFADIQVFFVRFVIRSGSLVAGDFRIQQRIDIVQIQIEGILCR